jgi:hypothetical protein
MYRKASLSSATPRAEGNCRSRRPPVSARRCTASLVSKHRDRAYRAGRSLHWIKVKNPASPAMLRVEDGSWYVDRRLD